MHNCCFILDLTLKNCPGSHAFDQRSQSNWTENKKLNVDITMKSQRSHLKT